MAPASSPTLPLSDPLTEVERRFADQSPAWGLPRIAALQNLRALWGEAAKKRAHDHRLNYRAMGAEDIVDKDEAEMPGDINIQGDKIETHYHTMTPTPVTAAIQTAKTRFPAFLLALSMLGGGAGIGYLLHDLKQQPAATPVAAANDTDTITEFDLK